MIRKGSAYAPFEVLSRVVFTSKARGRRAAERGQKVNYDGDLINLASGRLQTFARVGLACFRCGIEGQCFFKERHPGDRAFHFNLYAVDHQGSEVRMTRVRVYPKVPGRKDDPSDWQTACEYCAQQPLDPDLQSQPVERDILPFILLTDEGQAVWATILETMIKALPERDRDRSLYVYEAADLLDDGNLLIQARLKGKTFQYRLEPGLWRWNASLPVDAPIATS